MPGYDSSYRPGDNLYTNSLIAIDAATGKFNWHFQYTPNDNRDYDETGTHILIDTKVNGEDRKIVSHAGRNGFNYIFDRLQRPVPQGRPACRQGDLDQGHRSQDRQAGRLRSRARRADLCRAGQRQRGQGHAAASVRTTSGGNNYWPAAYSPKTKFVYIPSYEGCADITPDYTRT